MNFNKIEQSLVRNFQSIWVQMVDFLPKLLGAILLLVIGYFIAKFLSKVSKIFFTKVGLDKLSQKVGIAEILYQWKIHGGLSGAIAKLIFFFVFLIFLISTAEILEFESLSRGIHQVIAYIPNLVGAFIVFFGSAVAGHFAKQAIANAGESMNLDVAKPLSSLAYFGLLLIGLILAFGQLKIETDFLTHVIQIILVSAGVAMALSLGFGSREVSKNLISGVYLKDSLREGAHIKVGSYEGELVQIKPVSFELRDQHGGKIILPNSRLLECEIISSGNDDG